MDPWHELALFLVAFITIYHVLFHAIYVFAYFAVKREDQRSWFDVAAEAVQSDFQPPHTTTDQDVPIGSIAFGFLACIWLAIIRITSIVLPFPRLTSLSRVILASVGTSLACAAAHLFGTEICFLVTVIFAVVIKISLVALPFPRLTLLSRILLATFCTYVVLHLHARTGATSFSGGNQSAPDWGASAAHLLDIVEEQVLMGILVVLCLALTQAFPSVHPMMVLGISLTCACAVKYAAGVQFDLKSALRGFINDPNRFEHGVVAMLSVIWQVSTVTLVMRGDLYSPRTRITWWVCITYVIGLAHVYGPASAPPPEDTYLNGGNSTNNGMPPFLPAELVRESYKLVYRLIVSPVKLYDAAENVIRQTVNDAQSAATWGVRAWAYSWVAPCLPGTIGGTIGTIVTAASMGYHAIERLRKFTGNPRMLRNMAGVAGGFLNQEGPQIEVLPDPRIEHNAPARTTASTNPFDENSPVYWTNHFAEEMEGSQYRAEHEGPHAIRGLRDLARQYANS